MTASSGNSARWSASTNCRPIPTSPPTPPASTNRKALREALIARLASFERDALLAQLEKASVPASPINNIGQMFADPQTIARGMRMDLDDGHGNALPSVRAPMLMSKTPLAYERPSPRLGEHTAEILAELEKPGE